MTMLKLSPRALAAAITLVAIAAAVLASTQGLASARPAKPLRHQASGHRAHSAVASGLFGVLQDAPSTADLGNGVVAGAAEHDASLLPSQARLLSSGTSKTWLIPTTSGGVCLALQPDQAYVAIEQERGLAHALLNYVCNDADSVATHGLVLRTHNDIVGLVPDGVTSVNTKIGGVTASIAVHGNLFHASAAAGAGALGLPEGTATYTLASGAEVTADLP